ncbi:MAG: UDP-4-amino-4,6-dideoxy-N-acetyl-beta-L-altrosamine transaminase [Balneolaceae bacterium]|nr:UDP-4-amino-4,6-dideoxy-N-acetyl-beta-L-altrosamine transaminase [Saccharospirillum sp.]MCH8550092.1 UDP-4-amino-4,6-dideoxy-N-acetyl-beta-L-altrosamine transaminase [Balneolaceae bacterium]
MNKDAYIPYGRQDIQPQDIEAVVEVLRSDWITQGPVVPRFEQAVSDYCNATYGVAANSATSALHIACLSLNLGPNDWLWTSPITFVASANAGRYCGAHVDFVDIDPETYNMSVAALKEKLHNAEKSGTLPKVVMPVHFAGQPCDMPAIAELAQHYGFRIIEDASHAIGAKYNGYKVGACSHSDITVFSFHPVKIITTGEGGMATTNDPDLARRMRRLGSHGITREPKEMDTEPDGSWYYQQIELGFNYRMTDIQAALGLSQMERLDAYIQSRHELADRYNKSLSLLPVITPRQKQGTKSAWHLYVVKLDKKSTTLERKEVFYSLRKANIGVNIHYIPVHTQPDFKRMGFKTGDFPIAESYYKEAISIPLFPHMTSSQQEAVITALKEVLV